MREGGIVIKYKLYAFSGSTYVVPLDKYEYVDNTVGSYFEDYCAGLLTSHELDSFVEECIIDNGGEVFGVKNDNGFYVVKDKEWWNVGLGGGDKYFPFSISWNYFGKIFRE